MGISPNKYSHQNRLTVDHAYKSILRGIFSKKLKANRIFEFFNRKIEKIDNCKKIWDWVVVRLIF